jgi:hypothetical protein
MQGHKNPSTTTTTTARYDGNLLSLGTLGLGIEPNSSAKMTCIPLKSFCGREHWRGGAGGAPRSSQRRPKSQT